MTAKRRISILELEKCIEEGCGVSEAARRLGVTKGAVSKKLKSLKIAVVKNSTLRHAGEIVEKRLDAIDQIKKINNYANELLDLLMRWNRGDNEALQILESQVRKVKVRGSEQEVTEYRFKDPRELALKAMAEIRGQIALQFEIVQGLYDIAAVSEFQREVLGVIGEVDADARKRIVENLKKRSFIQSALELPQL